MKLRRLRKWAKWTCTLAAGAAVALAVFSGFYECNYSTTSNAGDSWWRLGVLWGQVAVERQDGMGASVGPELLGWHVGWERGWNWGYSGESPPLSGDWPWHAGVVNARHPDGWEVGASVLYPVALTLLPTALLWYADRRRFGPGLCKKCGYDRHGLTADAKCPECGTVLAPVAT